MRENRGAAEREEDVSKKWFQGFLTCRMIRHVVTGKRKQFWGDKGACLVLNIEGEIPKPLKHEPNLMLKCLAKEGNLMWSLTLMWSEGYTLQGVNVQRGRPENWRPSLWGKPWSAVWLEGSEKVGLNLSIWKSKIMVSDPITSWQIDGETMETVTDSVFLGRGLQNHCRW